MPPSSSQSTPRQLALALILLIAGAMSIAFAPIFVRLADVGPVSVVAWRLGLSIPFALVWWSRVGNPPREKRNANGLRWLILSGVLLAIDLALWHIAIQYTSVANSTFILNLAPIFVTIGAWLLLAEAFGGGFVMALIAAIVGAALLVRASFDVSHRDLLGDMIALAAAVFYAGYQLAVKHCRKFYHTAHILAGTAIVTPLVLAPVIWLMGEKVIPQSWQGWGAVIGIALVCQVLGQGLITWAVGHVRANLASVVLLVQPVTAAGLAVIIFNETLTPIRLLGCGLVLAGIVLARRASK
ncbi:DMT family transporter [Uliginosibacterium sp. H3]|uniref:DMT family transporter n=1 Tax=Uliginosibacterium silvisoli TaxID=3114758 RepID=A0ABU6K2V5_9RHOO|nr:DMT family transporter [Uliginosibacterium sp. H3]